MVLPGGKGETFERLVDVDEDRQKRGDYLKHDRSILHLEYV